MPGAFLRFVAGAGVNSIGVQPCIGVQPAAVEHVFGVGPALPAPPPPPQILGGVLITCMPRAGDAAICPAAAARIFDRCGFE